MGKVPRPVVVVKANRRLEMCALDVFRSCRSAMYSENTPRIRTRSSRLVVHLVHHMWPKHSLLMNWWDTRLIAGLLNYGLLLIDSCLLFSIIEYWWLIIDHCTSAVAASSHATNRQAIGSSMKKLAPCKFLRTLCGREGGLRNVRKLVAQEKCHKILRTYTIWILRILTVFLGPLLSSLLASSFFKDPKEPYLPKPASSFFIPLWCR